MTTAYDEVRYPNHPQVHPDALATPAALRGLSPAPLDRCRVLEIGCGDGTNLISVAETFPDARFYGFDLAAEPVADGTREIEALALANIRLEARDILDADSAAIGEFDYVVAHGMYSWMPPPVREAMMALVGRVLAPHGVAFVSFAALPGCRLRQVMRDQLLYHLKPLATPRARMDELQSFLRIMIAAYSASDPLTAALRAECSRALERPPAVIFHDELAPFYHPVYLHEFTADAERHGLRHFGDVNPQELYAELYPGPPEQPLHALSRGDPLAFHQYADFMRARMFRESLLCRSDAPLQDPDPDRLRDFHVSTKLRAVAADADPDSEEPLQFRTGETAGITTASPMMKRVLLRLGEAAPGRIPFAALGDDPALPAAFLRMYAGGLVRLHVAPAPFTTTVSERPRASSVARRQASRAAAEITTLLHEPAALDAAGRHCLTLLDGTRDHAAIARDMAAYTGQPEEAMAAGLPTNLDSLARLALLVA